MLYLDERTEIVLDYDGTERISHYPSSHASILCRFVPVSYTHLIFLMGVSMGAATVLLASGLDLPDSVHGIIADCGYSSIRDICRTCLPKYLPHVPVAMCIRDRGG